MSIDQRGPVAPKDPTVKRPGFYIMRGKNISAAPREDGTCLPRRGGPSARHQTA